MTGIRVWAPRAAKVELHCGGRRLPMRLVSSGWWTRDDASLGHGDDYGFFLDGEGPFPDPRSPWQPAGVHGPSRNVDQDRFRWTDSGWQAPPLGEALIYEMHPGTFTGAGTFAGAIGKLDHLVELGVTHLELMPVAEFSGDRGWGYDGVDLYAPHHAYGGPDGLKRLVDACHAQGVAVLLDVVYNHLGPAGNYLGRFGPYFTDRYATPWGEAVNLDGPGSDEVRRFFIDNALMWLRDYHLDGLRLDAVHAILDTSAVHFLEQLAAEVKELAAGLGRHLVLVAESDLNDPRLVRSPQVGGYGLDAQWNEDFHHALQALLTGDRQGYYQDFGRLEQLAAVLSRGFCYDGRYSPFRRRRHGRSARGIPVHRFVGCLQNHDQVGNRARGERTAALLTPGLLRVGAALVMTSPFVPMLFQGEEWGASTPFLYFTDHRERALAEAVRRGRREEFAAFDRETEGLADPQAEETFHRSRLDWSEPGREPHRGLLRWYRELAALRRRRPVLREGRLEEIGVRWDEGERWLVMVRGEVVTACNFADRPRPLPCPEAAGRAPALASAPGVRVEGKSLLLPPESVALFA